MSHRSFVERVIPPPPEATTGPTVPRSLTDLARRLPLERKVAQLFLFGFASADTREQVFRDLANEDLGGIVFGADNYDGPQQLAGLTDFAAQVAASLRELGINGVLGPDVDVDTSTGGAYTRVSFSDIPSKVAEFAAVTVKAYAREKMLTAPKHFPGLGAATQPTDDGPANIGFSPQQLAARDLVPFKTAFDAGARGVLVGHGLYSTDEFVTPASQSRALMVDLLRRNMRFGGITITDDLESPAVKGAQ